MIKYACKAGRRQAQQLGRRETNEALSVPMVHIMLYGRLTHTVTRSVVSSPRYPNRFHHGCRRGRARSAQRRQTQSRYVTYLPAVSLDRMIFTTSPLCIPKYLAMGSFAWMRGSCPSVTE